MAASVVANEFVGHGMKEKSKPRPFEEPQRVGHPEKLNQFLGVDVLKWYDPSVFVRQWENTRKDLPPARPSALLSDSLAAASTGDDEVTGKGTFGNGLF